MSLSPPDSGSLLTVSSRPRAWSSYTNIHAKDGQIKSMNSAEEISKYKDNYYSPTLSRRLITYAYERPEKKNKKWSIGSLFRRKKKDESESSSEEETQKKSFFKKRKAEKKKKAKSLGTFDHVVIPRNSHLYPTKYINNEDLGVLSDPTGTVKPGSVDSLTPNSGDSRRSKKSLKARAEARRNLKCDSSSDEESQRSASSSRLRSDESLSTGSLSRRSRSARTERYLRRHSRDGELPTRTSDDSTRSLSRSPLPPSNYKLQLSSNSFNSSLTIPPSHGSHKPRISNSTSNPSYKPPLSLNEYNRKLAEEDFQRSLSYDVDINKVVNDAGVVYVPVRSRRNLSLVDVADRRQPPAPPPRDPKRLLTQYFDTSRPKTYYFDNAKPEAQKLRPNSRSISEDCLPNNTPEKFNYLADKKPRSRRPIVIRKEKSDAQKALEFWKQQDEKSKVEIKPPQMFTCQTHVETQVFLPSVVKEQEIEDSKRKSTNLEEALDELEAIYNSLRLGDEDLLERAEQREKDVQNINARGTLSDSSFSYEPFESSRRRRMRKSHTMDRRGDDMAFRKLNKERSATINDPQSVVAKVSYLESSPFYGREAPNDFRIRRKSKEPDVTFDDVLYRNVKYANSTPRIVEPQLPFGIPVGPISSGANSDYLHATPSNVRRSRFKPRKIPDLVTDDLAFRALRKDENKDPALPNFSDDLKNNNLKFDNSLKKKRAIRSLSANIGSIMNGNEEFNKLTDIADAMEIARQVLREKESKINATRRAFLSDTDTNNGNEIKEVRLNFLNSLKDKNSVQTKPPLVKSIRPPKESTPIPVSPMEDKFLFKDQPHPSLDDLLQALTSEGKDTTSNGMSKKLSEIDAVSEQAKLCEKLLEDKIEKNESDHDYENIEAEEKCTSPFEEHKAELIATFQELKKNVDLDLVENETKDEPTGEKRVSVCTNQSEPELARVELTRQPIAVGQASSLESLKSPKLVLETSRRSMNRDEKPSPEWYRDPAAMAVACSYGLACAHQLASMDLVAILGILFAVLSFIAALIF